MPDFRAVLSRSDNVGVTRQSSAMTPKLGSQAKSPGHCIWKPAIGKHWPSFLAHLRRPSWRRDQVSSVRISGAATSGCRFGERAVPALPQVQRVQLTDRTRLGGAVDAGDPHRSCFVPSPQSALALAPSSIRGIGRSATARTQCTLGGPRSRPPTRKLTSSVNIKGQMMEGKDVTLPLLGFVSGNRDAGK